MDTFRLLSVTVSLILGLGIARLLSAAVAIFRSRDHFRLDWIPLAWASSIFLWLIHYWWIVIELPVLIESWTFIHFLALIALALLLYVAATLVLPIPESIMDGSLAELFEHDGRWALLFVSAYFVLTLLAEWYFLKTPPYTYPIILNAALAVLPPGFLRVSSRKKKQIITILYLVLCIWSIWERSPKY